MTPIEKLQAADQLLAEWLTDNTEEDFDEVFEVDAARTLVQEAIEELTAPAQEPVIQNWMKPDALCDRSCLYACTEGFNKFPTCVPPPSRTSRIGLTDEEFVELCSADLGTAALIRAVESKLKEKDHERSQRASDQDD